MMSLDLEPEPRELVFVKGVYVLNPGTQIVLPEAAGVQASTAARQLQAEIQVASGLALAVVRAAAPPGRLNTILLVCGKEEAAPLGLEPAQMDAPSEALSGAYSLSIQRDRIVLYAPEAGGLAHGVQALGQIVHAQGAALPTLIVRDWPDLGEVGREP
jgi:N-acetyl-beta-hexosaminidase